MNAVDLLVSQHRRIEASLEQVLEAEGDGARAQRFAEAGDLLTVHIASEEELFYPAVRASRTEDVLLESLEEHLSLKRLLSDLLALAPDEQTFVPKFKVLKEQSEHHHEEEEENLFPKVRKLLDEARLESLGGEMAALQQRLQRQGEPREAVNDQVEKAAPLK
ncbi:MAG TPA: hemerythrin domain-containing protein [Caldimonas sp.]|nr:hemerythrin domain-containing protein [Caldimonas sp.]HEX2543001.1 hemerythrin domain-containing protein [Caldimonas sp.]